jgi:hypothetical protein
LDIKRACSIHTGTGAADLFSLNPGHSIPTDCPDYQKPSAKIDTKKLHVIMIVVLAGESPVQLRLA